MIAVNFVLLATVTAVASAQQSTVTAVANVQLYTMTVVSTMQQSTVTVVPNAQLSAVTAVILVFDTTDITANQAAFIPLLLTLIVLLNHIANTKYYQC